MNQPTNPFTALYAARVRRLPSTPTFTRVIDGRVVRQDGITPDDPDEAQRLQRERDLATARARYLRQKDTPEFRAKRAEYDQRHHERRQVTNREWRERNRAAINARQAAWARERRHNDPAARAAHNESVRAYRERNREAINAKRRAAARAAREAQGTPPQ